MPTTTITTDITIDAAPEHVWSALTDTASFPEWNPFVRRLEGELSQGTRLTVRLEPPGGRGMTLRPTVVAVEPGRRLAWLGHLGVRGLFDGEHSFVLEPLDEGGTRFVHSERFGGVLTGLLLRVVRERTVAGFEGFNLALRDRVEARSGAS